MPVRLATSAWYADVVFEHGFYASITASTCSTEGPPRGLAALLASTGHMRLVLHTVR